MIKLKTFIKDGFLLSFFLTLLFGTMLSMPNSCICYSFEGFIRWKLETETDDSFFSSPGVADFNGDGLLEIIVCHLNNKVYCINYIGNILWTFSTEEQILSSPCIVDLNNDGRLEVLISDVGHFLYCLNDKGKELWRFPLFSLTSSPCVADIDNDGQLEIIVTEIDHYNPEHSNVICLSSSGNVKWSLAVDYNIVRPVSVADLDEDGTLEILFAMKNKLECLNHLGVEEWSYITAGSVRMEPSVVDLDNDGSLEVLFSSSDEYFYCLNSSGEEEWCFHSENSTSSPVAGDLDNDNKLEVVFITFYGHKMFCLTYQGLEKWNITLDEYMTSPSLVDIDNDGQLEIIGGTKGGSLYIVNYNGSIKWTYTSNDQIFYAPSCVVDLDGDGVFEVLIGATSNYDSPSYFYCFSFPNLSSSGGHPWYCYRGSNYRTGNIDSDSDFIDDLTEKLYQTNRTNPDTDGDGFLDGLEVQVGLNPLVDDSKEDSDNDGLTNYEELKIYHTSIFTADTDRDGRKDGTEIRLGTDPLKWDNWAFLFGLYFLPLYSGIIAIVIFLVKFKLKKPNEGAS
ncbi:MAG: FG-GAP-like repeat-containing protein [Candidatus Heimdallarchaeaceae archaeon]